MPRSSRSWRHGKECNDQSLRSAGNEKEAVIADHHATEAFVQSPADAPELLVASASGPSAAAGHAYFDYERPIHVTVVDWCQLT
jgi:hypothetical protein